MRAWHMLPSASSNPPAACRSAIVLPPRHLARHPEYGATSGRRPITGSKVDGVAGSEIMSHPGAFGDWIPWTDLSHGTSKQISACASAKLHPISSGREGGRGNPQPTFHHFLICCRSCDEGLEYAVLSQLIDYGHALFGSRVTALQASHYSYVHRVGLGIVYLSRYASKSFGARPLKNEHRGTLE